MSTDDRLDLPERVENARVSVSRNRALVFISHDTRDAKLAEAFSKLLSSVSAGVLKSFRSSDNKGSQGIEFGVEWYPEIMNKLDTASDVVCLLTQRSVNRPWILYEAGVAQGKLGTTVYGLALGIPLPQASVGPFAQFQNSGDDVDQITKLVMQLLRRIPNSEPDIEAVNIQVGNFKERVDAILSELYASNDQEQPAEQQPSGESVATLFEEVKVMFQDLPSRIEGRTASSSNSVLHRKIKHLHPVLFNDVLNPPYGGRESASIWLIMLSPFRDDLPWIYELGIDFYKALKTNRAQSISKAAEDLLSAVMATMKLSITSRLFNDTATRAELEDSLVSLANLLQEIAAYYRIRSRRPLDEKGVG